MTIGRPGVAATGAVPTESPVTDAPVPAVPFETPSSTPCTVTAPPKSDSEPTCAWPRAPGPQPLPRKLTEEAVRTDPFAGYVTPLMDMLGARGSTATSPSVIGDRPGSSSANPASRAQRGVPRGAAVRSLPAGFGAGFGGSAAVVVGAVVVAVAVVVVAAVVVGCVVTSVVVGVVTVAAVSLVVVSESGDPA